MLRQMVAVLFVLTAFGSSVFAGSLLTPPTPGSKTIVWSWCSEGFLENLVSSAEREGLLVAEDGSLVRPDYYREEGR
jgi:hypothetical protein